jgi:hypothetical protein
MRERSPGNWEIRVAVGIDPISGRTVQRSFAFHGGVEDAELRRKELAGEWAERRVNRRTAPFLTVGELLERWLCAHHDWRPATWIGARSNVKALSADPLAVRRVSTLKPEHVRAAMAAWSSAGASVAVVSGRFRVLRSAIGWAHVERIIDVNPLSGMRGPMRPGTRLHLSREEILRLLDAVEALVTATDLEDAERRHKAEQIRLLVRLAADSGHGAVSWWRCASTTSMGACSRSSEASRPMCSGPPRRVEHGGSPLAARRSNCGGRVLRPGPVVFPRGTGLGPWLFSHGADHHVRLTAGALVTGLPSSPRGPRSPRHRCTACAIVSRRSSSDEASCSVHSSASGTGIPRQRCATTRTPCLSRTRRWPTTSTSCSALRFPNRDQMRRGSRIRSGRRVRVRTVGS